MSKIFVCYELNHSSLRKAEIAGCDTIIFIKKPFNLEPENIHLVNARDYDRASYAKTFADNKNKLSAFKLIAPDFFEYKNIGMLEAINKDFFWSVRYEGMLKFALKEVKKEGDEVIFLNSSRVNLKAGIKILKMVLMYLRGVIPAHIKTHGKLFTGRKYAFYVKNEFQYNYSSIIANELGKQHCIFLSNHFPPARLNFLSHDKREIIHDGYKHVSNTFSFTALIHGIKIFGASQFYILLNIRQKLLNGIHSNLQNFNSDVKVFFLTAQENTGFGNITALMGKQHGKLIVNSHNGLKAPDAFNSDNHFDIWCCWDEKMKEMLHRDCLIDEEQLVVVGHVMEDVAKKHIYKNSFQEFYKNKEAKLISLFSVWENPGLKWDAVNALLKLLSSRINLQLIIRLHPQESKSDWEKIQSSVDPSKVLIVFPISNESKTRLYDQLLISDVAVVFGSTVAIECKWFNVPCITLEAREKSMIYSSDDKIIFHEKNVASMIGRIEVLLNEKKEMKHEFIPVGKKIKTIVNSKLNLHYD